ncbi:MAG: replication protein RepA [Nanoarchaeota archaeon]
MAEETSSDFDRRRLPAKNRLVAGIKPDDLRVRLLGTVVDSAENSLVLDDGTGKINVNFDDPIKAENNKLVRVFGRVVPLENGFELHGEIVQDMSLLDMSLLKRMKDLGV